MLIKIAICFRLRSAQKLLLYITLVRGKQYLNFSTFHSIKKIFEVFVEEKKYFLVSQKVQKK